MKNVFQRDSATSLSRYRLNVRPIARTFRFKQPAGTSRGVYHERRVWYVVVTSPDEPLLRGVGECAPLYDLSCDYGHDYEARLHSCCRAFAQTGEIDDAALRPYPSIRFGLETARLSALASLRGDYLALYDTPFTRGEVGIPINGLVWMGNYDEMLERMEQKLAEGYRCVKLKIGAIDFERELELIKRLRSRYGRDVVELRVDANGAFTPEEAPRKLEQLARFDLHSIEQPIRAGQWREMAELCRRSPLPIALDEELIGVNDVALKRDLLDTIRPHYIILKPSLHGGLAGAEEWMKLAAKRSIPYWVTSALESNVGLNAIAQWTSAVAERTWRELAPTGAGPLPEVHGLGTGRLFVDNFQGTHLDISGDRLWVTDEQQRRFVEEVHRFNEEWDAPASTMAVHTSGSTGTPQTIHVSKAYMAASARMTCNFLGLQPGDTALLCMPLQYIAGRMVLVRCRVGQLRLVAVSPSSHPFARLNFAPTFVAMTPHQVIETLKVVREATLLRRVKQLIIGGGAVSKELATTLRTFPNAVWSTYGMTETFSHIALRRLNGPEAADGYLPLAGISLSQTSEGCLVIDAPDIGVAHLVTNDLVEFAKDGSFRVLGRKDNVVCSGGLKLRIEDLEARLGSIGLPYVFTAVPDATYGEALTLMYEGSADAADELKRLCRERLGRYEVPKHYLATHAIPRTETDKPARAAIRQLAVAMLAKERELPGASREE